MPSCSAGPQPRAQAASPTAHDTTAELAQPTEADLAVCVRIDLAVRMLHIGKTKFCELIGTGELETIHFGRRRLMPQASIEAFVERLRNSNCRAADPACGS